MFERLPRCQDTDPTSCNQWHSVALSGTQWHLEGQRGTTTHRWIGGVRSKLEGSIEQTAKRCTWGDSVIWCACGLTTVEHIAHRVVARRVSHYTVVLRARPGDLAKLGPFEPYMNMSHVRNGYDPVPVAKKTPRAPARLMGHRKKILAIGFKPRARSLAGNASMLPSSRKANAFSKSFGEA